MKPDCPTYFDCLQHGECPEKSCSSPQSATPCDLGKLLGEFERLVLDANDEQLPHRAVLPVTKRLNEVRAQILSLQSATLPTEPVTDLMAEFKKNMGIQSATLSPIATVINNNQPGWTAIVETDPHVTLDVGTKLYRGPQ